MKKIALVITIFLLSMQIAKADNLKNAFQVNNGGNGDPLDSVANVAQYDTNQTSIISLIQIILKTVFSFLGILFLGLMIYSGYKYMMAGGNEDEIDESLHTIRQAIIGLIIIIIAYAISELIIEVLTKNILT